MTVARNVSTAAWNLSYSGPVFPPSFFHPACWPVKEPHHAAFCLLAGPNYFNLSSFKQQLLGSPRVVLEHFHHHHHHHCCYSHYHHQTSLDGRWQQKRRRTILARSFNLLHCVNNQTWGEVN